jgi:hypothetical protein
MLPDAQRSWYVHKQMHIQKPSSNAQASGEQVASKASSKASTPFQYQQFKLAMDARGDGKGAGDREKLLSGGGYAEWNLAATGGEADSLCL